jgi:hypothetical protein
MDYDALLSEVEASSSRESLNPRRPSTHKLEKKASFLYGVEEAPENLSLDRFQHNSDESHIEAVATLLSRSVESLPAYIELSRMMLVLSPLTEHQDRKDEIVDWASWRQRGWCRLELLAAKLSRNDTQVLVVRDRRGKLEFMSPLDEVLLPPG